MKEEQLEIRADALVTTASTFIVESHADYSRIGEHLSGLRSLKKEITAFFKPMKQSADAAKKVILDREKAQLESVKTAEKICESKMDAYDTSIEELRESEEIDEPEEELLTEMPSAKGVSKRKIPYHEVVCAEDVNPAFVMPDEKKIKAVVKSMGRDAETIVGGIVVKFKSSFTVKS